MLFFFSVAVIKKYQKFLNIQAKCADISDENLNVADDDEGTFNYRWPHCFHIYQCT